MLNFSALVAASTSDLTLISIGSGLGLIASAAVSNTFLGEHSSNRSWTNRTLLQTLSESWRSTSCIFWSFLVDDFDIYHDMTSSLSSKWRIGSNILRFECIAEEMLVNDGMNTPSNRNGPMNSAIFLVMRNGTSCFSNNPVEKLWQCMLGKKQWWHINFSFSICNTHHDYIGT